MNKTWKVVLTLVRYICTFLLGAGADEIFIS